MAELLFSVTDIEPTSSDSGKMWINTNTGQLWIRMNNDWYPIISGSQGGVGYAIPNPAIYINNKEVSQFIKKQSIKIENIITSQVDTAEMILQDTTGENKPLEGCDVTIYSGDISEGLPTKIFGGVLVSAPQVKLSLDKYNYSINCLDYSWKLNNRLVVENFENKNCKYIIEYIINKYMPSFSTAEVENGLTIESIRFNYKTIFQCIEKLAIETNYEWYVDYDNIIHFFSRSSNAAPYELNETSSSGQYRNLLLEIDISQLRNYITVQGGYYLSDVYTQNIVADGQQEEFLLAYAPYAPITVSVNSVAKTVSIDNITTSGYDFVLNFTEKIIKNLDLPKLNYGDIVTITYKYKIPILVRKYDKNSINELKAIEGGTGIHEYLIIDDTIATVDEAVQRANSELSKFAFPHLSGSFITTQSGYKAGQLLTINIPTREIDTQVIIQQVTTQSLGLGNYEYKVEFSTDEV